jgi:large subunit ribosomal protein L17
MKHQIKNKKLNLSSKHRKAFLRNQALHFIKFGELITTLVRVKEVRRLVEKVVTIARDGNDFNARRKVLKELPYDDAVVKKLFTDIAPNYVNRPGGYTRVHRLGIRISDTAKIGRLSWV